MFEDMIMPRKTHVLLLTLFCVEFSAAQATDSIHRKEGIIQRMYAGGITTLDWYDLPIATADLSELLFVKANSTNKLIKFPPTRLDQNFQPHVGVHGSETIVGQVGEAGAAAFLGIRLLVNIGSDLAGGDVTSTDYHRTFWFYKSIIYTYSLTMLTKNLVYRMRPDGSDSESFFSGHSSTAFCTASYLSLETSDWYDRWETTRSNDALRSTLKIGSGIALYAGATYVAYARMHDEKHYLSDVVVGAVVGTIVGSWMYYRRWSSGDSGNENVSFLVVDKTPTIFFTMKF